MGAALYIPNRAATVSPADYDVYFNAKATRGAAAGRRKPARAPSGPTAGKPAAPASDEGREEDIEVMYGPIISPNDAEESPGQEWCANSEVKPPGYDTPDSSPLEVKIEDFK